MISVHTAGLGHRDLAERDLGRTLELARADIAAPFAPQRLELVARVGAKVLRGVRADTSPAVVHFAYWTRKAALNRLAQDFESRLPPGCHARPIGLVFHLPPQNVETVFLYSWVLAYLAGTANVVRLPSALSDEMRSLLDLFLEAFEATGEVGQLFVGYPATSDLSVEISAGCDARVVWGGDAKVEAFASVPLRDGGRTVWFGDRFSFSAASGEALAALDEAGRRDLAERLCNDIYVFGQMACSSPHVLYVVGDRARHQSAVGQLFDQVSRAAREKGLQPPTGHAIHKIVEVFAAAGRGEARSAYWRENVLTAVEIAETAGPRRRVGGGYLDYRFVDDLAAIMPAIEAHDQTLTYFGFTPSQMTEFVRGRVGQGITRVVPIGQALDFDSVWDGYDLTREFTSLVRVI